MRSRMSIALMAVIVLSTLISTGCRTTTPEPREPEPTEAVEVPAEVRGARDAALASIAENYDQAPPSGLGWTEENVTPGWPDAPVPGWSEYRFTAGDWTVTVGYPVVPPEQIVYQIVVDNPTAAFTWEGRGDARGRVTEGPEFLLAALDVALGYTRENYGDQAPASDLAWTGGRATPEGLVGSESFQYTAGDWEVTISYPVVAPEAVVYQVVLANATTGFRWEGEVDAAGRVTEPSTPVAGEPVACWYGRVLGTPPGAQFDDYLALEPEGAGEVGIEGAGTEVEARIENLRDSGTYAHFWGTLACDVLDYGGCQLLVARLRPEGPEGPFFDPAPVEGWEGTIISTPPGAQWDDIFITAGDFGAGYGIESPEPGLAAQLQGLRDTGTIVRVWGEVRCPTINAYGTGVSVNRIEIVWEPPVPASTPTPWPTPAESWTEPVENWSGEIISNPAGSQFDDYFQRQIASGGQYGIESLDPTIQGRIVALRDTRRTVFVWGTLHHNVPDFNASQIVVTRLEVQEAPEPPDVTEEPVEGWTGTIVKLPPGFQFGHYFERDDGERFDIGSRDDAIQEQINGARWTGAQIRVWGTLLRGIPAMEARHIEVERLEVISGPAQEARNLTPFATASASSNLPTDHWGQYQSWMATDLSLETAWVEGVEGPGLGEWFMLSFPGTIEVQSVKLDVGYDSSDDIFFANNRIKRVTLVFSSGEEVELGFADRRGMQEIPLVRAPGPNIVTTFVKVVIEEVFPGSRYDDTCLAEIEVWGKTE